jgi:hypothetical protein
MATGLENIAVRGKEGAGPPFGSGQSVHGAPVLEAEIPMTKALICSRVAS